MKWVKSTRMYYKITLPACSRIIQNITKINSGLKTKLVSFFISDNSITYKTMDGQINLTIGVSSGTVNLANNSNHQFQNTAFYEDLTNEISEKYHMEFTWQTLKTVFKPVTHLHAIEIHFPKINNDSVRQELDQDNDQHNTISGNL